MNRHQRRAAKKSKPENPAPGTAIDPMTVDLGALPDSETSIESGPFSGLSLGTVDRSSLGELRGATASSTPVKTGFMVRMIAKILFSGWVMRRIKNPAIESLLASVATQMGRDDIADELMRRQAGRSNISF